MKSTMSHSFSQVPKAEIQRSSFNRSHGYKTTFNAGDIVPVLVDEALPGDTFNLRSTMFARVGTPIVPIMDNMYLDVFYFAVPMRLIWNNWEKFNGAQDNPGDSTSYLVPQMVSPVGGYTTGTLSDYLGIPVDIPGLTHSSLWHRAYNLIYNQWFKDQNLQNNVTVDKGDGPDTHSNYVILKRGKRHDYFTSALPWAQKGTAVSIPLGTRAPVSGLGVGAAATFPNAGLTYKDASTTSAGVVYPNSAAVTSYAIRGTVAGATGIPDVYADLSLATAATINALRQSFQIQKLLERDARGGTRYTEIILSHFGVSSPDARLQRAELLGTTSSPVNFHPIAQTSGTGASGTTTPQGNLSAMATLSANSGFTKSFTEHCLILGLVSVRADLNYQQGLDRMFSRSTRYDFYWPALSHIGEQSILNKEIYSVGTSGGGVAQDNATFGFIPRYDEYRYKNSKITGKLRSQVAGTLQVWHLAQYFSALPSLNAAFIVDPTETTLDRSIATPAEPQFIFDSYNDMKCARPMPTYSVPGLIDHF